MLFGSRVRVRIRVRIRFSVWLVSGYAHVFVLLAVVAVTLPYAKAYNTCIAPQTAYRSCSGAGHVIDRASVQPIGRGPSLRPPTDL